MKWVWVVMILIGLRFVAGVSAQDVFTFPDGVRCGMEGDAVRPKVKELNRYKNRYTAPSADQIDPEVTLEAMLAPGDDIDRFDGERGAVITGYVVDVKVGGVETCNCHETAPDDRDTHIELALSPHASEIQRVIVEVAPRWRAMMADQGIDWTTGTLSDPQNGIKGKWITVSGWLLFDTEHVGEAENTEPGGDRNWRATCWEIHPITSIQVVEAPPTPPPHFHPQLFAQRQSSHAVQLNADPSRKAWLRQRNARLVAEFGNELDEYLPVPRRASTSAVAACPPTGSNTCLRPCSRRKFCRHSRRCRTR